MLDAFEAEKVADILMLVAEFYLLHIKRMSSHHMINRRIIFVLFSFSSHYNNHLSIYHSKSEAFINIHSLIIAILNHIVVKFNTHIIYI